MFRVYPKQSPEERSGTDSDTGRLQGKVEGLTALVVQLQSERDDLRRRLDATDAQREQVSEERAKLLATIDHMTRILTDRREKAPARRKWFNW